MSETSKKTEWKPCDYAPGYEQRNNEEGHREMRPIQQQETALICGCDESTGFLCDQHYPQGTYIQKIAKWQAYKDRLSQAAPSSAGVEDAPIRQASGPGEGK